MEKMQAAGRTIATVPAVQGRSGQPYSEINAKHAAHVVRVGLHHLARQHAGMETSLCFGW